MPDSTMTLMALSPFGAILHAQPGMRLEHVSVSDVRRLVDKHRLLAFRGFPALVGDELPEYCRALGELLEWEFGVVNELKLDADKRNYIYTGAEVPLHWDGAFVERAPHYIFFICDRAAGDGTGGETLFCDTTRVLERTSPEVLDLWEGVRIRYQTEKVVHYGGAFTAQMLATHPTTGERVLRFAEPVADLNPLHLTIEGVPEPRHEQFLADIRQRIHHPEVCYAHRWQDGDIVIADNHVLLHGRRAFATTKAASRRLIRRVNVL